VSLASPASTGIAAPHAGDFGIYAAFEQKLYRLGDHGIAASASLLAPTTARQTATSSIAVRTAAWSLLASATDARTTNLALLSRMPISRPAPAHSTRIFARSAGLYQPWLFGSWKL
jgi:hypothetical protein